MHRRPSVMPPPSARARASMAPGASGAGQQQQQQSKQAMAAELERTEQSITIALQEIDRNFARANKIVGESILPVIEQYSQESKKLWSGAEFWKNFLESAANVKLSGYEENVYQDDTNQENGDQTEKSQSAYNNLDDENSTSQFESDLIPIKHSEDGDYTMESESNFDYDLDPQVQSTPNLQRRSSSPTKIPKPKVTTPKLTPRKDSEQLEDDFDAMSLDGSLAATPVKKEKSQSKPKPTPKSVLRHQVLDKNWGIQATPVDNKPSKIDDEFSLSPDIQPPKSTVLGDQEYSSSRQDDTQLSATGTAPSFNFNFDDDEEGDNKEAMFKTPEKPMFKPFTPIRKQYTPKGAGNDSDSDIDMMSPPVTMQFAGPSMVKPQQPELVKTPARQAARTIVDDILKDVGDESESINASITKTQFTDYLRGSNDDDDDTATFH